MRNRILVAVVFIPIMLVGILYLPTFVWAAGVSFISSMAAFELLRATGEGRITPSMRGAAILSAILIPLGNWYGIGVVTGYVCMFAVMLISFWNAIRTYDGGDASIGFFHVMVTLFGGGVIPLCLSGLVILQSMEHGRYLVILTVGLGFVTDSAAYFGGVFLGKHRGITKVSPNKSLEGYIAGLLGGAASSVLFGLIIAVVDHCAVNLWALALCGLLGAMVTELGDLVFSLIKRQYGVKDYGNLLPGHGGMLDRFDSLIFCTPVMFFFLTYLPVF